LGIILALEVEACLQAAPVSADTVTLCDMYARFEKTITLCEQGAIAAEVPFMAYHVVVALLAEHGVPAGATCGKAERHPHAASNGQVAESEAVQRSSSSQMAGSEHREAIGSSTGPFIASEQHAGQEPHGVAALDDAAALKMQGSRAQTVQARGAVSDQSAISTDAGYGDNSRFSGKRFVPSSDLLPMKSSEASAVHSGSSNRRLQADGRTAGCSIPADPDGCPSNLEAHANASRCKSMVQPVDSETGSKAALSRPLSGTTASQQDYNDLKAALDAATGEESIQGTQTKQFGN
jgi:hypothetical protein